MEEDKSSWKTCCDKYFKCGFCYNPEPPVDTCKDALSKANKSDKEYKKCCAQYMFQIESSNDVNKNDAQLKKCCADFKCLFKN